MVQISNIIRYMLWLKWNWPWQTLKVTFFLSFFFLFLHLHEIVEGLYFYFSLSVCVCMCLSVCLSVCEQNADRTTTPILTRSSLLTAVARTLLKLVTLGQRSRSQWRNIYFSFIILCFGFQPLDMPLVDLHAYQVFERSLSLSISLSHTHTHAHKHIHTHRLSNNQNICCL